MVGALELTEAWFDEKANVWRRRWRLSPGLHTLTFSIWPDASLALEESATLNEILGVSLEKRLTIEIPEGEPDMTK